MTFSSQPQTVEFTVNFENDAALQDDIALFEATDPVLDIDLMDHTDQKENSSWCELLARTLDIRA